MIHVAYGTSNIYAKFAGTSMLSLFENTNENVTVHILHDNTLTPENRENFVYIAGRYNQQVKFYNVENEYPDEINQFKSNMPPAVLERFNIAAMFRLLLPKIIPLEKIIYLDSDTIVNLDIKELWRVELEDNPIAAVSEIEDPFANKDFLCQALTLCHAGIVKPTDYFNSGVLLMNLKKWRQEAKKIWDGVEFIFNNHKYGCYGDQDILNYCFSTQYLKLPLKFNIFVRTIQFSRNPVIGANIYHYLSGGISLGAETNNIFQRMYWEYFAKTPWFNSEILLKLFSGVRQMYVERQKNLVKMTALMSGKTRTFFTDIVNTDAVKNILAVKENEEIIVFTSNESVQYLINLMTTQRGKVVFFLLIMRNDTYKQLRAILVKGGFVEGQDFINGKDFLSEVHGVPLDSWKIIKDL